MHTDPRVLRLSLITRLQAARVIAMNRQRNDLAMRCELKIAAIKRLFDNEIASNLYGIEAIETACRDCVTMDEVRARYRACLNAQFMQENAA